MCGRYASTRTRSELLETFKIEEALADEEKPPDYNVAPTKTLAVVLARPPRDDEDAEPVRQLRNLIWGFTELGALGLLTPHLVVWFFDLLQGRGSVRRSGGTCS